MAYVSIDNKLRAFQSRNTDIQNWYSRLQPTSERTYLGQISMAGRCEERERVRIFLLIRNLGPLHASDGFPQIMSPESYVLLHNMALHLELLISAPLTSQITHCAVVACSTPSLLTLHV